MSTTSTITSASKLQTQFLNLLVTQLKNQDPTSPMDSSQMTAQLAQFSQLEQMENLSSQFSDVLSTTQKSYANSLVGKTITYSATDSSGNSSFANGTVNAVDMENSEINLVVGDSNTSVALADVLAVQ